MSSARCTQTLLGEHVTHSLLSGTRLGVLKVGPILLCSEQKHKASRLAIKQVDRKCRVPTVFRVLLTNVTVKIALCFKPWREGNTVAGM